MYPENIKDFSNDKFLKILYDTRCSDAGLMERSKLLSRRKEC